MAMVALVLLSGAFGLSALLTAAMRRLSPRLNLLDRPGGHKQHGRVVPLGGGVAIILTLAAVMGLGAAVVFSLPATPPGWLPAGVYHGDAGFYARLVAGLQQRMPEALVMLAGAAALFGLGLFDDVRPLGPGIKLLAEIAVVGAVVGVLQVRAAVFLPSALSAGLTVLWIVAIINATNFLDNMDGLSAGVVILCGGVLFAAAAINGQLFVPALLLAVIGAAGGFLLHNFPPARIFMGDSGSLVLGYFLGLLTVQTTYTRNFEQHPHAVLMPLIILAVPLYDLLSVCVVRLAQGRNPIKSDRSHFSHRLLARGMPVRATLVTIYLATVATALAAVFLMRLPLTMAWIVFAQTLCIVGIIALLEIRWTRGRQP